MYLGLNLGDTDFCLKLNCFLGWEDFSDMFLFSKLKALFTNFRTIQHHSHFLREILPAPHPQPPQALIWELLLSAACSVLLPAYLLLTQKGHCQLLINLEPTDPLETSMVSALSPLLSFLLILLGGASFTVCNFPKLKNGSTIYYARELLHWHLAELIFKHRAT